MYSPISNEMTTDLKSRRLGNHIFDSLFNLGKILGLDEDEEANLHRLTEGVGMLQQAIENHVGTSVGSGDDMSSMTELTSAGGGPSPIGRFHNDKDAVGAIAADEVLLDGCQRKELLIRHRMKR
jgi:hypothetical protein